MRYKNTDATPVKERCSSWRPSDRYLPYANAECIGTMECDPCKCNGDEEKCDYYENVRKRGAEKKKTEDVVEVVRCKDCEFYEEYCDKLIAERDEWVKRFREMHEIAELKQKQANAEIENYKSIAEFQKSSNMKRYFELKEKDKEIERLNTALERLADESDARDIDDTYAAEKIRTDAINEFAERVKSQLKAPENPWNDYTIDEWQIDQIAKEMKNEEGKK